MRQPLGTLLCALTVMNVLAPTSALSQDLPTYVEKYGVRRVDPKMERLRQLIKELPPKGPTPQITFIAPTDPDGLPFAKVGETTFEISGANFAISSPLDVVVVTSISEIHEPQETGPRTEVIEWAPQPTSSERLTFFVGDDFPGGTGHYLIWIASMRGGGWSNPAKVYIYNPKSITIERIDDQFPGLETTIYGSGFSPQVTVTVLHPDLKHELYRLPVRFVDSSHLTVTLPPAIKLQLLGPRHIRLTQPDSLPADGIVNVLAPHPMDLYWDSSDVNGFPLNPKWGAQLLYRPTDTLYYPDAWSCSRDYRGWPAPCITQRLSVNGSWVCALGAAVGWDDARGAGHLNWMPTTYTGIVSLQDYSTDDGDYNFILLTTDNAGSTSAKKESGRAFYRRILLEFASPETVSQFDSPWWRGLHRLVVQGVLEKTPWVPSKGSEEKARQYVKSMPAIVTGLMGLDCAHDCHSELHPVYAMAINSSRDPTIGSWAVFVRNWGTEGYCSDDENYLPLSLPEDRYVLKIPWERYATSVDVARLSFGYSSRARVSVDYVIKEGDGIYFIFELGNAVHRPLAWGEVELRWQFNNNAPPPAIAEPPSEAWGDTPTSYEDLFEELVSRLPPDRRAKLEEELGAIRRESQPKPAKPIVMIPRMVADLDPERLRPAMPPGFANTGTGSHEREYRKIEALVRAGLLSREQQMELLLPEKLQSFLDRIKKEEVPPP